MQLSLVYLMQRKKTRIAALGHHHIKRALALSEIRIARMTCMLDPRSDRTEGGALVADCRVEQPGGLMPKVLMLYQTLQASRTLMLVAKRVWRVWHKMALGGSPKRLHLATTLIRGQATRAHSHPLSRKISQKTLASMHLWLSKPNAHSHYHCQHHVGRGWK